MKKIILAVTMFAALFGLAHADGFSPTLTGSYQPTVSDTITHATSAIPANKTTSWQRILEVGQDKGPTIWKAACCKVCRKGKACGNSCINRSYTCRKRKGCACNG